MVEMNGIFKKLFVLSVTGVLLSGAGVLATWTYMDCDPLSDHSAQASLGINEFAWQPEEILPDNQEAGKSHIVLIESILNNIKNGLNSNKGDRVCEQIKSYGIMYSQQNIQGGNLKHLFVTNDNQTQINQLEFAIEYVTDTFYYVYTFEDGVLESGTPDVTYIEAYRTVFIKTNEWDDTETTYGNARIQVLSYRTIAPDTWTSGAPKNQTTN